jgi:hypothetical protein
LAPGTRGAEGLEPDLAELLAGQQVDDEVGGRVEADEQVRQVDARLHERRHDARRALVGAESGRKSVLEKTVQFLYYVKSVLRQLVKRPLVKRRLVKRCLVKNAITMFGKTMFGKTMFGKKRLW